MILVITLCVHRVHRVHMWFFTHYISTKYTGWWKQQEKRRNIEFIWCIVHGCEKRKGERWNKKKVTVWQLHTNTHTNNTRWQNHTIIQTHAHTQIQIHWLGFFLLLVSRNSSRCHRHSFASALYVLDHNQSACCLFSSLVCIVRLQHIAIHSAHVYFAGVCV